MKTAPLQQPVVALLPPVHRVVKSMPPRQHGLPARAVHRQSNAGGSSFPLRGAFVLAWLLLAVVSAHGGWTLKTISNLTQEGSELKGGPYANGTLITPDNTFMYGVAQDGGEWGAGSIYSVSVDGTFFQVLHSFGEFPGDGTNPVTGLVLSPDGILAYGTTESGGEFGNGTVFSFDLFSGDCSILYSFSPTNAVGENIDGANPLGTLAVSADGYTLYGTASAGGANGDGTIFAISLNDGVNFNSLHSFSGSDGANPISGLVLSPDGTTLYGTTADGGIDNVGTVFSFNLTQAVSPLDTLWFFRTHANIADGAYPTATLLLSGVWLYGTTTEGGNDGLGTVFKITTDGNPNHYQQLASLNGANPGGNVVGAVSSLVLVDNYLLLGMSFYGGTNLNYFGLGYGEVFSVTTDGLYFPLSYSFTGLDDGSYPWGGLLLSGGPLWSGGALYGTTTGGGTNANIWGTVFQLTYQSSLGAEADFTPQHPGIVFHWDPPPGRHHYDLQSSPTMTGSFENIDGATSPYTNTFTDSQRFFRLVLDTNIPPTAPDVITSPAINVGSNAATLNGGVVANGADTTIWFLYGLNTNYGSSTATTLVSAANTNAVAVSNVISGLVPGTLYHFLLMASNSVGTDQGADFIFTTAGGPAAPFVVTTQASDINPTVAFLNGTIQPNGLDTAWWFEYGPTNTPYAFSTFNPAGLDVVAGTNTAPVPVNLGIIELTPATTYHFQLYGSNSDGIASGGDLTFTTSPPLPDAFVQTFAASNVTTTSAVLLGSVNNNGSQFVGYFEWGTTTNYGSDSDLEQFDDFANQSQPVDESYVLTNLIPNTTYHYRIVGYNGGPDEALGNDVVFMTSAPFQQPPPVVVNGSATSVSPTSETINATVNPEGAPTTAFFVYYETGGGVSSLSFNAGSDNSTHMVQTNLTGLMPDTTYNYDITAYNSGGSSQGTILTFTTGSAIQQPPTVWTLAAFQITDTAADLSGLVNPNGTNSQAQFEWGTTTNYGNISHPVNVGSGSVPQTNVAVLPSGLLTPLTTYNYRLVGWNAAGTNYGTNVTFTTGAASYAAGMTFVSAGTFLMGDSLDGETDAIPTNIYVSAFYMDKDLVSYSQWQSVYNWAIANGYGFVDAGSGKAPNHPVQGVNWFDCVKWCNARSQQAGLTPVYYTDAALTRVYTNGEETPYVNWGVSGFRLPTEAEWEMAARGGLIGKRYPWGNTISEAQANYDSCTDCGYDDSGPDGYNINFDTGALPYTSPVGYFAPNGFGLYDMAGNVEEWVWDWYGTPYGQPTAIDPTGPASGTSRVTRGGGWNDPAEFLRPADRYPNQPGIQNQNTGLRPVNPYHPTSALIPGGSFTMGNVSGDSDLANDLGPGQSDCTPLTVYVSPFYMATEPVSENTYGTNLLWGQENGYVFDNVDVGVRNNYPATGMDWFDVVKWCNARSEEEHLTPVYYTNNNYGLDYVYRNLPAPNNTVYESPTANGYRLPTEAEWEMAARGGSNPEQRFPLGNTISEANADYTPGGGASYDLGGTPPTYDAPDPFGTFKPNGYGLYNMAGDVREWVWDYYGTTYGQPTTNNPTGPTMGPYNVVRGGGWAENAQELRCAYRQPFVPGEGSGEGSDDVGFRWVAY